MTSSGSTRLGSSSYSDASRAPWASRSLVSPASPRLALARATIDYEGAAAPDEDELSPEEVETMEEELSTVG